MQKSVVLKIYIIFYCKTILEKPKKNLQIWLFKPKLAFFKKYSKTSMSSKRGKNQYFFKNKNSHGGENIFQQVDKILDHSDKKCFGFTWPWPQLSQCALHGGGEDFMLYLSFLSSNRISFNMFVCFLNPPKRLNF